MKRAGANRATRAYILRANDPEAKVILPDDPDGRARPLTGAAPALHLAAVQHQLRDVVMAIGEFGGAPGLPADGGIFFAAPMYWFYEMSQAALNPSRAWADATKLLFKNPLNPLTTTTFGKSVAAACELFERSTRRYGRPEWDIATTMVGGERVPVRVVAEWERPFCRLLHFERAFEHQPHRPQPRLLIVAPMSGHYSTLLRGTVEAFLPNHDVYITEWQDARMVPLAEGRFDLDDYIDYVISILHFLGGDVHVVAVCQPAVPVLAAVARMEAIEDPYVPRSMVLMGGPIDTRVNPTGVNQLAKFRGIDWFRRNVITKVPFPHPGVMRDVYPGFLQLNGFVSMNIDRHIDAHRKLFRNLVGGDGDSAQKHREFYDEYLAVMDLDRGILSPDGRDRVHSPRPAAGLHDSPRRCRRCRADPARRLDDRRRRARRHIRRRPDRGGAPAVRQYSRRAQGPLAAARGRPLRRVQRVAVPLRNRAAHRRLRAVARFPPRQRRQGAKIECRCFPKKGGQRRRSQARIAGSLVVLNTTSACGRTRFNACRKEVILDSSA